MMALLTQRQRDELSETIPEWGVDGETIRRTFRFGDFVGSMGFVTRVAILAEKANHHPDIDVRWNKVTLVLTTHDEGGLTTRDLELAKSIDGLVR